MLPFHDRLLIRLFGHQPRELHCVLSHRRIYLLPTGFGLLLLGVAICIWIGALNYGVSLAYVLSFWMIGLLLVAMLMAYRQLFGLSITAGNAAPVFAGQLLHFDCMLSHTSAHVRQVVFAPLGQYGQRVAVCGMKSGEKIGIAIPTQQRGILWMPACQVWSDAPFGLVRAFSLVHLAASGLAYPTLVPDPAHSMPGGEGLENRKIGGETFSHLTSYRYGDPPKKIAWKVLARRDVLSTKHFSSKQDSTLVLNWCDYGSEYSVELRLSHLAWRVEQCEQHQENYILKLPGQVVGPQIGQRKIALAALAMYRNNT